MAGKNLNTSPSSPIHYSMIPDGFQNDFFDIVTAVSTIEHIGLGRYGDPIDPDGDKKAIREIYRILKVGGKAIVTVPFGKRTILVHGGIALARVYDFSSLQELFSEFETLKIEYIIKQGECWRPAALGEAENIESWGEAVVADALIVAERG